MIYRYRTLAAKGQLTLLDDAVLCETTTYYGTWAGKTPYRFLEPYPIQTTLVSPSAIWIAFPFALAAMFGLVFTVAALREQIAQPQRALYASVTSLFVGISGVVLSKRFCKVDWIIFPTTLTGHRVAFTRCGPDAENYERFVNALQQRIETDNAAQTTPPNKRLNPSSESGEI